LECLLRLALVDARSFWDADGRLKKPSELTAEQRAALAGWLATERLEVSVVQVAEIASELRV
jgi:hypothetical protein